MSPCELAAALHVDDENMVGLTDFLSRLGLVEAIEARSLLRIGEEHFNVENAGSTSLIRGAGSASADCSQDSGNARRATAFYTPKLRGGATFRAVHGN